MNIPSIAMRIELAKCENGFIVSYIVDKGAGSHQDGWIITYLAGPNQLQAWCESLPSKFGI